MIIQNPDSSYSATSVEDFAGWEILYKEWWKPGVKRVHARKLIGGYGVFMAVFAEDNIADLLEESGRNETD